MLARKVMYQGLGFGAGQVWPHLGSCNLILQYDVDGRVWQH